MNIKNALLLSLTVILFLFIGILLFKSTKSNLQTAQDSPKEVLGPPQISGWIAWWEEAAGYLLAEKHPQVVKTVSPVWFTVDKDLKLSDIGKANRIKEVSSLKKSSTKVFPSLGSELTSEELSPLLNNSQKSSKLIGNLVEKLVALGVDGVDVDLEGIKKEDRDAFTAFLDNLSKELKKNNLQMAVAVHAQNGKPVWEGVEGQDLKKIGQIADTLRVMTYDEHSTDTDPGPISSFKWEQEVALYTKKLIDKEKIVMGIPSYGYIWVKDGDSKGLQFDEFNKYLQGKEYTAKRDNNSGELVIKGSNFTGWLSDSVAMIKKIENFRAIGFNKFVIWHLGGMDEKFFDKNWSN